MVERAESPELEVKAVPEEIKLPKHLSEAQATEVAFKANVKGDDGSVLTQPSGSGATFNPPANTKTLISWAKGPIEAALTWLGAFWLRMIKKGGVSASD